MRPCDEVFNYRTNVWDEFCALLQIHRDLNLYNYGNGDEDDDGDDDNNNDNNNNKIYNKNKRNKL
jgi:hypothetical protein